jgi:hypothetical protein
MVLIPTTSLHSPLKKKFNSNIVTYLSEVHRYNATLLSLLGNSNISMDTLITPVFLRCMVTNSWKASFSIAAGSVKEGKTIHAS